MSMLWTKRKPSCRDGHSYHNWEEKTAYYDHFNRWVMIERCRICGALMRTVNGYEPKYGVEYRG
jgi:hypothetical protein